MSSSGSLVGPRCPLDCKRPGGVRLVPYYKMRYSNSETPSSIGFRKSLAT